jgi:hypothetical protein
MSERKLTEKQRTLFRLADFILDHQEVALKMGECGISSCGTVGCIAGFGALMLNLPGAHHLPTVKIGDALGLTREESRALFIPSADSNPEAYRSSRDSAVKVVRHFARTGRVDWSVIHDQSRALATGEGK